MKTSGSSPSVKENASSPKGRNKKKRFPYLRAVPDILKFQAVTALLLALLLWGLEAAAMEMIISTGRVAVSSGDYLFIFTCWQGWALILLGVFVFLVYVIFDLNMKIFFSDALIRSGKVSFRKVITDSILSGRRFFSPAGLGIVLFISLLAPLAGIGISISLTEGLYIPSFITSVIYANPVLNVLYRALLAAVFVIGILHLFCLHELLLGGKKARAAVRDARRLFLANWRNLLLQFLLFAAKMLAMGGVTLLLALILPLLVTNALPLPGFLTRYFQMFICLFGGTVSYTFVLLAGSFLMMRLTELYYRYTGAEGKIPPREKQAHPLLRIVVTAFAVLCAVASAVLTIDFEQIFPKDERPGIIAHRAGGSEGPENTVEGLETAIALGAYGAEIDIQRTADGHYIVNHDSNFSRVAGVGKKPQDMTLEEIRRLQVKNPADPKHPARVATCEEMLDAAKGRILLFVELKGKTADRKMADDAVRLLKEKDMLEDAVLISLKYDLIDYIETTYPEVLTGYLTFLSFGDTEKLNCDFLGLEEESATEAAISAIHRQDKKIMVWTANGREQQYHFLCTKADAIITDNISQANEIAEELENRSDFDVILDWLVR